jgi:hypothetical protein
MASQKGRSQKASKKAQYISYNYEKNKAAKLQRHMKSHPEDDQSKTALKNIKYTGTCASKDSLGWINRFETLQGYVSDKKGDQGHLYADISGAKDARDRAKMAAHIRKVERKHQHDLHFKEKSHKKSSAQKPK